jgi:hypothetical protein
MMPSSGDKGGSGIVTQVPYQTGKSILPTLSRCAVT